MLLAAVCKGEVRIYSYGAGEVFEKTSPPELVRTLEGAIVNGEGFSWNSSGSLCGIINKNGGVTVYDVGKGFVPLFEANSSLKGIKSFYFSPLSTYLVTAERFEPKTTPVRPNMALWHVGGKMKIVEGRLRQLSTNSWPSMKWSENEVSCCRVLSLEDSPPTLSKQHDSPYLLQVLNSKTNRTDNLEVPNVTVVEVCPYSTKAAVFVTTTSSTAVVIDPMRTGGEGGTSDGSNLERDSPKKKNSTTTSPISGIRIFDLLNISAPAILRYDFVKCVDTCVMRWSKSGRRLLVQAGSEVDETGQSYYGTSHMYLVDLDSKSTIQIDHEGHVQDFQWDPTGETFCLISGVTPFTIQLFSKEGALVHDFGRFRKNTVRFSSKFGRFLALGGFGNLAGELDFIDVPSKSVLRSTRAECTVECEWAPNGRLLMTSSTHPRMRVDNNFAVFNYYGEKVETVKFDELYSVKWKPSVEPFADEPASQRALAHRNFTVPKKAAYKAPSKFAEKAIKDERPLSAPPTVVVPAPPPPPSELKIPCPDKDWFYRDPKLVVHGPYERTVMLAWSLAGYFKPELPVRAGSVLPFVELSKLFPGEAFASSLVVPAEWLRFGGSL